jgi:hypothetical protein
MFAGAINAHARRNWFVMKYTGKRSLTVMFAFLGLAGAILGYLIYPGRPSESQVMTFEGFIELPSSGGLTILDYLTLNDKVLFVTSESSGALFKIALSSSDLRASTVSEMPGAGAAHGVALVPDIECRFRHTERSEHGRCFRSAVSSSACGYPSCR